MLDFPAFAGEEDRAGDGSLAVGIIGDHAPRDAERVSRAGQREAVAQTPGEEFARVGMAGGGKGFEPESFSAEFSARRPDDAVAPFTDAGLFEKLWIAQ